MEKFRCATFYTVAWKLLSSDVLMDPQPRVISSFSYFIIFLFLFRVQYVIFLILKTLISYIFYIYKYLAFDDKAV